jgi:hypothetical protein
MAELGITLEEYLANAAQLRDQGKIVEHHSDQMTLADGWAAVQRSDSSTVVRGGDAERDCRPFPQPRH